MNPSCRIEWFISCQYLDDSGEKTGDQIAKVDLVPTNNKLAPEIIALMDGRTVLLYAQQNNSTYFR